MARWSRPCRRGPGQGGCVAPGAEPGDAQLRQQMREDWGVVGLAGRHQHDQRSAVAVDEVVDLGGQPAAGTADAVVRRLDARIRVIRPSPLCGG